MKRNNLSLLILLLATAIGSFSACQGDVEEWVNPDQSISQPVTKAALVEKTVAMTEAGKFASFFRRESWKRSKIDGIRPFGCE